MDNIFREQIRTAIALLFTGNFQKFITWLFKKLYNENFTPLNPQKDKGCDGILNNDTIIAIYGPTPERKSILKAFTDKIGEDYDAYKTNWKGNYPNWGVVYNGELTADRLQFLERLHENTLKMDINHLMKEIENRIFPFQRDVAVYLGIQLEFMRNSIIKQVIDDLIRSKNEDIYSQEISSPHDIEEKIKKNYDSTDFKEVKREHEEYYSEITHVYGILKAYDEREISVLKFQILSKFNILEGDFKIKFNELHKLLIDGNEENDYFSFYVRVLLLYLFEICLLGESP